MANPLYDALIGDKADSNKPFLRDEAGNEYSYNQFAARAGQAAHALQQLGVCPGDRVMVQAQKCPDILSLYLGAIRCGAIFVPLNTTYTPGEVAYFLSDAEPAVFICSPERITDYQAITTSHGAKLLSLAENGTGTWFDFCGNTCSAVFASARSGSDVAAILYTSGTTGRSKGAMLTHDNLLSNAAALVDCWRISDADTLLHTLPVYHSHGLFVATNTILLAGAQMLFMQRFDAAKVVEKLFDATVLMGVPTHYVRLLRQTGLSRENTARMRLFTSGSAPLLASTHEQFTARTGHEIVERYGLTETSMNTSNPYDGPRKPGTVGLPLPGIDVEVRDNESGAALGAGQTGSVEVRGPNVFAGYWRNLEKTYAEFRDDGFFITGDLGCFDDDGYLTIVGRSKDLVITGGLNVYPKEVEAEIDSLDGVVESAVIGVPHDDFGEAVTAIVVPQSENAPDKTTILAALESRLAKFKQPKNIYFTSQLPRNAMGKVQKNLLREKFSKQA